MILACLSLAASLRADINSDDDDDDDDDNNSSIPRRAFSALGSFSMVSLISRLLVVLLAVIVVVSILSDDDDFDLIAARALPATGLSLSSLVLSLSSL